jgi:hypothetical protein
MLGAIPAEEAIMACPHLPKCPFFNDRMGGMPALADMMKRSCCEGAYTTCARFRVARAKTCPAVPADLFPNQIDRLASFGVD